MAAKKSAARLSCFASKQKSVTAMQFDSTDTSSSTKAAGAGAAAGASAGCSDGATLSEEPLTRFLFDDAAEERV